MGTKVIDVIKKTKSALDQELSTLKESGLVTKIKYAYDPEKKEYTYTLFRAGDNSTIKLVSDLTVDYNLIFGGYYIEYSEVTDPNGTFDDMIKWFFPLIVEYLKRKYHETIYTKKDDTFISKQLYFDNSELGRRSLNGPVKLKNLPYRMFPWMYNRIEQRQDG